MLHSGRTSCALAIALALAALPGLGRAADEKKLEPPQPKSCFDDTDDIRRVGRLCNDAINSGKLTDAQKAMATLRRGQAWAATGKADDKAMADYDAARRLNPRYAEVYVSRGLLFRSHNEVDRAIDDYTAAIKIDPSYAAAYVNRGTAWRAKGELDKAMADYDAALKIDPENPIAFGNRCNGWRDKGELDRAIADCTEALKRMPRLAAALNNRGSALRDKGELDKAREDFDHALTVNPRFVYALINRAGVERAQGKIEESIKDCDAALKVNPQFGEALSARGKAHFRAGEFKQAAADFRESLSVALDVDAASWLALALRRAGEDPTAELRHVAERLGAKADEDPVMAGLSGKRSLPAPDPAAAGADASARLLACRSAFVSAEMALAQGRSPQARPSLKAAAEHCPFDRAERDIAGYELAERSK